MRGKPRPITRENIEELKEEFMEVEHEIAIAKKTKKEVENDLKQVLEELYSRELGFLILVTEQAKPLEDNIRRLTSYGKSKVIRLDPPLLSQKVKYEILKLVSGRNPDELNGREPKIISDD